MEWLLIVLVLDVLVGVYAAKKGRSGVMYFCLCLLITPFIAFIVLLFLGDNKKALEEKRIVAGEEVKCYFCAELIKSEAKLCKHCGKPSHPVYHGAWLKILEIEPGSNLEGTEARVGDAVYLYDGVDLKGSIETLIRLSAGGTEEPAKIVLVRDAVPIELKVPHGRVGVRLLTENAPKVAADAGGW